METVIIIYLVGVILGFMLNLTKGKVGALIWPIMLVKKVIDIVRKAAAKDCSITQ